MRMLTLNMRGAKTRISTFMKMNNVQGVKKRTCIYLLAPHNLIKFGNLFGLVKAHSLWAE